VCLHWTSVLIVVPIELNRGKGKAPRTCS
jgi:hypothetical protein